MSWLKMAWHSLLRSRLQLLIIILIVGQSTAQTNNSSLQWKATTFDLMPLNDVLFTEEVLLEVPGWSQIDCSKTCVETEGCVMCTLISKPQGIPGQCRIFGKLHTLKDAKREATGAVNIARRLCEGGYAVSCGRCLRAVKEDVVYTAARKRCRELNQGQLVMPQTPQDTGCVDAFIKDNGLSGSWAGVDDMQDPGVFRWNNGSLLPDNSTLWFQMSSEPSKDKPGEMCGAIYVASLMDGPCQYPRPFVCQQGYIEKV